MSNARALVATLLESGETKASIAREIGYSRAAVSRWLSEPGYAGGRIEAAIVARFSQVDCPALKTPISPTQCATFAHAPCPTSNTRDVRHWKTCQTCPHRPPKTEARHDD